MPIIIDTNCLTDVFIKTNEMHPQFKPVLEWITEGNGIMVYGGTKYKKELNEVKKLAKIIKLLKDAQKVFVGNDENINKLEEKISNNVNDRRFNDPHLSAIVIDTKCRIICTADTSAIPYLKESSIYPKGMSRPKIYSKKTNKNLLCNKYIPKKYLKGIDASSMQTYSK